MFLHRHVNPLVYIHSYNRDCLAVLYINSEIHICSAPWQQEVLCDLRLCASEARTAYSLDERTYIICFISLVRSGWCIQFACPPSGFV